MIGVGQGIVVDARRGMLHGELGFMDVLRRCRIDGPVEAEDRARAVRLEAFGFGRCGENHGLAVAARKEDEQRDVSIDRAEDGPVGGAGPLEAGVDDVLRLVRLVGLRDKAAAPGERILDGGRKLGKGIHGEMADEVGSGVAVE